MNRIVVASSLVHELEDRLIQLERLGALVAAAHLDVAIDALCRECDVARNCSDPD